MPRTQPWLNDTACWRTAAIWKGLRVGLPAPLAGSPLTASGYAEHNVSLDALDRATDGADRPDGDTDSAVHH